MLGGLNTNSSLGCNVRGDGIETSVPCQAHASNIAYRRHSGPGLLRIGRLHWHKEKIESCSQLIQELFQSWAIMNNHENRPYAFHHDSTHVISKFNATIETKPSDAPSVSALILLLSKSLSLSLLHSFLISPPYSILSYGGGRWGGSWENRGVIVSWNLEPSVTVYWCK